MGRSVAAAWQSIGPPIHLLLAAVLWFRGDYFFAATLTFVGVIGTLHLINPRGERIELGDGQGRTVVGTGDGEEGASFWTTAALLMAAVCVFFLVGDLIRGDMGASLTGAVVLVGALDALDRV